MANVITCIRIVCALVLIISPAFSPLFYILYTVCGISDVLDGISARHSGKKTALGARLDTVADIIFTVIVLIKTLRAVQIPFWLMIWIACIALIKTVNILVGFVMHKRFMTEHTLLNKISGILLFAVPLCICRFPTKPLSVLIILTCTVASAAALQEGYYIRKGTEIK